MKFWSSLEEKSAGFMSNTVKYLFNKLLNNDYSNSSTLVFDVISLALPF
jgi:hypothetical protein